jgi:hypothetical protein
MPFAINDIVECKHFCWRADISTVGINVLHARVTSLSGGGATETETADAFATTFGPLYATLLTSAAEYRGCTVRAVYPTPGIAFPSTVAETTGTITGEPLPPAVAGLISLRTLTPGRRGRGRVYPPFAGESSSGPTSRPVTAYLTELDDYGDQLLLGLTVVGAGGTTVHEWVVYHRTWPSTGGPASSPITGYVTRENWATIRKRSTIGRPDQPPPV